jgi:outer membrane protein
MPSLNVAAKASLPKPLFRHRLLAAALAVATGGALLLAAAPAAAQSKIAVIDVRRAVLETEEGLRVQATLKKLFDNRQVELDGKQRQLQADKEALEKEAQSGKTGKDALQKKYENLQRQAAELQNTMLEYQREMERRQGDMTTPILQKIMEAVKRIASQDGFEMVLEKSAAPYFRGDLEVTDRAIQMVNSGQAGGAPAGKGSPPAGGPGKPTLPPASPAVKPPASPAKPPASPPAKK